MAPVASSHLHSRHLDTAATFSVGFGVLACCIIVACCFWACIWPQIRAKFINPRFPSRTRFRDEYEMTFSLKDRLLRRNKRPPIFPSHPVVLHRNTKVHPHTGLRIYDPRSESPFRAEFELVPTAGRPKDWHHNSTGENHFNEYNDHLLSAPWNSCGPLNPGWPGSTAPADVRERFEEPRRKTILSDRAFGDAREYILAVPEPLFLRGTPSRAIDRRSRSSSALPFWEICQSDYNLQSDQPIVANSRQFGHGSTMSQHDLGNEETETQLSYISEVSTFGDNDKSLTSEVSSTAKSAGDVLSVANIGDIISDTDEALFGQHNKSIAALNRLRTYRSLTGAKPLRPLSRAGTLTRPKTPVAAIRNLYDRSASETAHDSTPGSITGTYSAVPTLATDDSMKQPSTAHTSFEAISDALVQITSPRRFETFSSFEEVIQRPNKLCCEMEPPGLRNTLLTRFDKTHMARSTYQTITANRVGHSCHTPPASILASNIPVAKHRSKVVRPVGSVGRKLVRPSYVRGRGNSSSNSPNTQGPGLVHSSTSPGMNSNFGWSPVSLSSPQELDGADSGKTQRSVGASFFKPLNPADETGCEAYSLNGLVSEKQQRTSPFPFRQQGLPDVEVKSSSPGDTAAGDHCSIGSAISTEMNSVDAEATRISIPRVCVRESSVSIMHHYQPDCLEPSTATASNRQMACDSTLFLATHGCAPGGARWL